MITSKGSFTISLSPLGLAGVLSSLCLRPKNYMIKINVPEPQPQRYHQSHLSLWVPTEPCLHFSRLPWNYIHCCHLLNLSTAAQRQEQKENFRSRQTTWAAKSFDVPVLHLVQCEGAQRLVWYRLHHLQRLRTLWVKIQQHQHKPRVNWTGREESSTATLQHRTQPHTTATFSKKL